MDRALAVPGSGISRCRLKTFFFFWGIFIKKTVWSSPSCDVPQRAGWNTAIESFWHCIFVEIWPFVLINCLIQQACFFAVVRP